jgi:hypothetical protein
MDDEKNFIPVHVFRQRLKKLGIDPPNIWTVRRWCQRKRVDARKIGRGWQIRATECQRIADVGFA